MEIRQIVQRGWLLMIAVMIVSPAWLQASFYKVYSGNGYDKGEGLAQLPDSGYMVTGSSSSFEDAPSQAFLMRLDDQGNFVWSRAYGGAESEEGRRVMIVPDYGFFVAGTSSSGASGNFDSYLFFTDTDGNLQWERRFDNGGWERIHDALLLADSSVVMVGETDATTDQYTDMLLLRYAKNGDLLWSMQLGAQGNDVASAIIPFTDTTVIIAGSRYVADSLQNKACLAEIHLDGAELWHKTYGLEGNYWFTDLHYTGIELKAIGYRRKTGKTDTDIYNAALQPDGTYLWAEEYYVSDDTRYGYLAAYTAGNGKYIMSTQTINPNIPTFQEGEDCFLSRYSAGMYWDGYGVGYNGVGQDQANEIIPTSDGYAAAVGFHTTLGSGGNSVFVVKIGNENTYPAPSTSPQVTNIVTVQELVVLKGLRVYPNPFETQLIADIPDVSFTYTLNDASGRELLSGNGFGKQEISSGALPAGIYLLHISHDDSGESAVVRIVRQ